MHTEAEYDALQRELQLAREKLALYEGTSHAAGQAGRILGTAGALLIFGPGLSKALLSLGRSWSSASGPNIEAVLGVAAAIVRRISWGLILGALCATLPLILTIQQNTLISRQNELIAQQNQLSEASRRAGLMYELTSILDKIDKEMDAANIERAAMNVKQRHTQEYKDEEHKRRANRRSIQPRDREKYQFSERLAGRIVALSRSLSPYRFLERDGQTTPRPLSPERGQLLLSLLETGADLEELNHVARPNLR